MQGNWVFLANCHLSLSCPYKCNTYYHRVTGYSWPTATCPSAVHINVTLIFSLSLTCRVTGYSWPTVTCPSAGHINVTLIFPLSPAG
ncbi:hypothetical protein DPMN_185038 [Dreissena polymorpha]|uniref:Uncharacterized protein n=1 Tax=Dreissena polymorpha TaxID=45954 RepID=A0A9D4DIZ0_DREPO|nr:hypothetical protein DPMN_185038 [Dreissena polymorpha]